MCKILTFCVIFLLMGCANKDRSVVDVGSEISFWMEKGWENPQILGTPESTAQFAAHVSSATAGRLTAVWKESGQRNEKVFDQGERTYLILTFGKFGGDSFVAILEKENGANYDAGE